MIHTAIQRPHGRKENKSKYELLEDTLNSNFDDFGSKLDQISKTCNKQNCTEKVTNILTRNWHKDGLIKSSRGPFTYNTYHERYSDENSLSMNA
jgi:hypothetical protein